MRGDELLQEEMFSYGSLSQRVPMDHPLRRVRAMADEAMQWLEPRFQQMYSGMGRPSVPPERLLRALLLQMLYSVRSERMLVEQMEYNLLFRWFVGLSMDQPVWDATSFSKNRERLLSGEVAQEFFAAVVAAARKLRLLSDEHFTVDGTLIEAWASEKSYRSKPGPPPAKGNGSGSGGEVLLADTHQSNTDPDARMYRKGFKTGWKLHHMAHAVSENEHGLVVATEVSTCSPLQERHAAIRMLRRLSKTARPRIVAADKGYHEHDFVDAMRTMDIDAHVPQYQRRRKCLVDPAGYARSSPINFIKNVKTPTLMLVGDRDGECPAPQSFEFWHGLRDLGIKTQLVIYPGEGHHFSAPDHQRDLLRRTIAWFQQQMPAR